MDHEKAAQPTQDTTRNAVLDRRARALTAVSVFLAAAGLVAASWATVVHPRTDDAEIVANFIGVAPVVAGPIQRLNVADNQHVKQGDLLFEIDDRPYKYALNRAISDQAALEGQIVDESRRIQAEVHAVAASGAGTHAALANVDRAQAAIRETEADVKHSQATLDRVKAEWTYADNNLHRLEPLLVKKFVTVDQVDQAGSLARAREQAVHEAESQLALSQAHLKSVLAAYAQAQAAEEQSTAEFRQSQSNVLTLDPLVAQRQARIAAINDAQYNYEHCKVFAPFDGRVTNLLISEGAYVHVGQDIFAMIDTRTWWVIANFRETQLKHVQPGMYADVYVMSAPDQRLSGVVESIGYGVNPDPSLVGRFASGLPDVQRTLSWVHLASRYPVRIRIQSPPTDLLRLSQSAVVIVRGYKRRS